MLTYGRRIPLPELDYRIEQIDAKTVREVCTRYIYDKCPALVGIGIQRVAPWVVVVGLFINLNWGGGGGC